MDSLHYLRIYRLIYFITESGTAAAHARLYQRRRGIGINLND